MIIIRWFKFIICILIILFFIFVIAPEIKNSNILQQYYSNIENKGIDAGALFYTDSEEALSVTYKIKK